jgi:hypothetical protein
LITFAGSTARNFREELEAENLEYGQLDYFNAGTDYTSNEKTKKLSVVEAWYKDSDGDVGLLTWVGDTILREQPKFFYKRDSKGNVIEYEEVKLPSGETVQVKCHVPDYFPFAIWNNIPREKSARGLADPYITLTQQEGIRNCCQSRSRSRLTALQRYLSARAYGGDKNNQHRQPDNRD